MDFLSVGLFKWIFKQEPYGEQLRGENSLLRGPEAGILRCCQRTEGKPLLLEHGSHKADVCRSCPGLGLAKEGLGVEFSGSCTLTSYETLGLNH